MKNVEHVDTPRGLAIKDQIIIEVLHRAEMHVLQMGYAESASLTDARILADPAKGCVSRIDNSISGLDIIPRDVVPNLQQVPRYR